MHMLGRLHSDIYNVIPYLLTGVKLQIKLTKAKSAFYLMDIKAIPQLDFNLSSLI